jgi:hypothetical protein
LRESPFSNVEPVWAQPAAHHALRLVTELYVKLDLLTPAERRDLANALLRAAWRATLEETRILLVDLLVEVDDLIVGEMP